MAPSMPATNEVTMPGSGNDTTLALRRLVMLIAPPTLKVVKMKFSVKVSGFSVKVKKTFLSVHISLH